MSPGYLARGRGLTAAGATEPSLDAVEGRSPPRTQRDGGPDASVSCSPVSGRAAPAGASLKSRGTTDVRPLLHSECRWTRDQKWSFGDPQKSVTVKSRLPPRLAAP